MPRDGSATTDGPREWRRKVQVSARMRSPAGWGDARILNVSARGLMIWTDHPARPGTTIELRHGDLVLVAKVVWQIGARAGLRSDTVLPVTDLMCANEKAGERHALWAPGASSRHRSRRVDEAAIAYRARVMEFATIVAVLAAASLSLGAMAIETLGVPLREMQRALGG